MSNNLAQAYLVGNAVDNPQIRIKGLEGGPTLTTFRVAMNHRYQGADGQWQDGDPCYMEVQCWGALGDNVSATVCKGMSVIVVGRIVQSTWESNGEDGRSVTRSVLRVRATHVGPDLGARNVLVKVQKTVQQNDAQGGVDGQGAGNPGGELGQSGAEPAGAEPHGAKPHGAGPHGAKPHGGNKKGPKDKGAPGQGSENQNAKELVGAGAEGNPPF